MEKSFCVIPLQPNTENTGTEVEELRSTYIANCVFNSFSSYTAIMLNIVTIHAIRKTSSLPKTLRTFLLSLAVSDVGVGLLGQPFYISLVVEWLQQNNPGCIANLVFIFIVNAFSLASFFGVVAVSVDRFLAIHLHLRYQELVTHKRVVVVVISIWVLSGFLPMAVLWNQDDFLLIKLFLVVIGVLFTTVAYIRIYLVVRRHKNEIRALQVQQIAENGEMPNFSSLVKSAVGIFYVYVVFLFCYLPVFISLVALNINGLRSITLKRFSLYSWTAMLVNSSLNPVIYCWKMRHIRRAIIDILRNMPWLKNRASHLS